MAIEQYFEEAVARHEESPLPKWKSVSTASDNANGCFDCNICLDSAQDPVVTLCGHLYCWPCIYKWIHFQSASPDLYPDQKPQCPICKADVSHCTLVPLYGRGPTPTFTEPEGKGLHSGLVIPRRPRACGAHELITSATSTMPHSGPQLRRNHQQYSPQHYGNYAAASSPMYDLGGTATTNLFNPMVGMFGEMVYARVFGNSETSLYAYPNSYQLTGNSSPRVRRHEMQADKSLNRISIFLFCCFVLCLLLF
ncbi:hypothetical protein HHK36_005351 [Tetracentron sinense]|uniref:E3 ubiquitin-protein ligase RMA n=1 Tax=Tetracentron sinense TaxID=13715 RepID=A0A835DQZ1_TETSI|nr:hypothetical protein HHK36_005351 [Tetracentron sinense]